MEIFLKYSIHENVLAQALSEVIWKGRFERISEKPVVIFDVAHNSGGVNTLLALLSRLYPEKKIHFIMGMLKDKQFEEILKKTEIHARSLILSTVDSHRSFTINELISISKLSPDNIFDSISEAIKKSLSMMDKEDIICIFGSHYIAPDVYKYFE